MEIWRRKHKRIPIETNLDRLTEPKKFGTSLKTINFICFLYYEQKLNPIKVDAKLAFPRYTG